MSFKNFFCIFVILAGVNGICFGGKDDLTVTMHAVKKCIGRTNSGLGRSNSASSNDGLGASGKSEELIEWLEDMSPNGTTYVDTPRPTGQHRHRTSSMDDDES